MIRLICHSLFNIAFKLVLLVVIVNLLFHYFDGRPLDWPAVGDLSALPDKLLSLVKALAGWLHQTLP